MKQAYIAAVREKLLKGENPDVVIAGLKAALTKKGHNRLLGSILKGALRELEHDVVARAPQIVLATKANDSTVAKAKSALAELGGNETLAPVVKTDDNLIGGFIVKASGKQIDASYKRVLLEMYQKVTAR